MMGEWLPLTISAKHVGPIEDLLEQCRIQGNGEFRASAAVKQVKTIGAELIELVQNFQRNRMELRFMIDDGSS